jgi:acrylyl-CoA reductase (NADPH)
MDSVAMPIDDRRALWARIGIDLRPAGLSSGEGLTEVGLDELDGAFDAILAGQARGRWVVRVAR